jgi:transposase
MGIKKLGASGNVNHLGILSTFIKEIGLIDEIDRVVGPNRRKVSVGTAVAAMIMNGLGLNNRALYLTSGFFDRLPCNLLFGSSIQAQDLNDDSLGTALDTLYETGVTETFYQVSTRALKTMGIEHRFAHLDSTTFSLHGEYSSEETDNDAMAGDGKCISITRGYSKDNAPELNQVVLQMITSAHSAIPLWIEVLSGNSSDKATFPETVRKFSAQFQNGDMPIMVADSALYSKKGLSQLDGVHWITRVPESITEAQVLVHGPEVQDMADMGDGYHGREFRIEWADIPQRWLLVHSEQAAKRECLTFAKRLDKLREEAGKDLRKLASRTFACEADAREAAGLFAKGLGFFTLEYQVKPESHYAGKGRPAKDAQARTTTWSIEGQLIDDQSAIKHEMSRKGRFIIATNVLDANEIPASELLAVYKSQGVAVERGFRFLKDPLFYAESMYLNSPKRIMALVMVMTMSLLVYSLCEKKLRDGLKARKLAINSQVKKLTDNPTLRWVTHIFQMTTYTELVMDDDSSVFQIQLDKDRSTVLTALGPAYEKWYFLEN